ncbi:HTH-type transcriptional activator HxlR [Pseudobythopirellula maris]|uniref:HTH-type transcriptional activator HxlR n=1 Tax=Pseudobythopirellula maris TaxID=2527991 RepID=A0A5C5ZVZ5_9BACT|nr:helix-turn-helix domain-containing protein [Pseudobythopirellula maris]TWT91151.1 HTH-type transcriptional activator HxlR [Pseudobythopirellula maris]
MADPDVNEVFEKCLGCRYMVGILRHIQAGVNRPGQLERAVDGLTAKVLSERLRRLVEFRVVEKQSYAETPPRVEYHLTPFGARLLEIVEEVERLQKEATRA